jgi:hypothetical protein
VGGSSGHRKIIPAKHCGNLATACWTVRGYNELEAAHMGTQRINTERISRGRIHTEPVQAERATSGLQPGDHIEAWHNGKLFHQGRVTDVVPKLDLFWILDARTGTRRLLDPEALEIVRVESTAPGTGAGAPRNYPAGAPDGTPNAEPLSA